MAFSTDCRADFTFITRKPEGVWGGYTMKVREEHYKNVPCSIVENFLNLVGTPNTPNTRYEVSYQLTAKKGPLKRTYESSVQEAPSLAAAKIALFNLNPDYMDKPF